MRTSNCEDGTKYFVCRVSVRTSVYCIVQYIPHSGGRAEVRRSVGALARQSQSRPPELTMPQQDAHARAILRGASVRCVYAASRAGIAEWGGYSTLVD